MDPGVGYPSYDRCYAAAARVLADGIRADLTKLDNLALPLLFLVRHCVELVLKALLTDTIAIALYRDALGQHPTFRPTDKMQKALNHEHDLSVLLELLTAALDGIGFDRPRESLSALIGEIVEKEGRLDTASRYSHTKPNRLGKRRLAFEKAVTLPVLAFQERLDLAIAEHMNDSYVSDSDGPDATPSTLQEKLWRENDSLMQLEGAIEAEKEAEIKRFLGPGDCDEMPGASADEEG